jgi:hypothetical protein
MKVYGLEYYLNIDFDILSIMTKLQSYSSFFQAEKIKHFLKTTELVKSLKFLIISVY